MTLEELIAANYHPDYIIAPNSINKICRVCKKQFEIPASTEEDEAPDHCQECPVPFDN